MHDFFTNQFLAVKAAAQEMGAHVKVLDYPLEECIQDGFMEARWCEVDPFHGNRDYGALILRQVGALL